MIYLHLQWLLPLDDFWRRWASSLTNGMVERFNERFSQVLRSHYINSADNLEQTLHRLACLYKYHFPQKALGQC